MSGLCLLCDECPTFFAFKFNSSRGWLYFLRTALWIGAPLLGGRRQTGAWFIPVRINSAAPSKLLFSNCISDVFSSGRPRIVTIFGLAQDVARGVGEGKSAAFGAEHQISIYGG